MYLNYILHYYSIKFFFRALCSLDLTGTHTARDSQLILTGS